MCSPSRLPKGRSARILRDKINWRLAMPEENKAEQAGSGMTDAQDKLQSSKTHARKAAEDLRSAAGDLKSADGAMEGEYRGKDEEAWGGGRGKAEQTWGG